MLTLADMPTVPGFETPRQLYCVAAAPAPLFGMEYPMYRTRDDWQVLYDAGVRGVVCLDAPARYDPDPVRLLGTIDLEDLVDGGPPRDPPGELARVEQAVKLVLASLERGEGLVVHCVGGRGRTGTVLGSVLVRLGEGPRSVIAYLDQLHKARGRSGWPESRWQHGVVLGAGRG
jgi:hypothetical protein